MGITDLLGSLAGGNNQEGGAGGLGGLLGGVLGQGAVGGLVGQLAGSVFGEGSTAATVAPMLFNWVEQQGGVQGAISALQNGGVLNGANIDASQLQNVIPQGLVDEVAQKVGVSSDEVYSTIGQILPHVLGAHQEAAQQAAPQAAADDSEQASDNSDNQSSDDSSQG